MVMQNINSLSLDELLTEVTVLVEEYGFNRAQVDNRVSALPDVRTIRYYTSLGLLDRPRIEGRQGRYQRRHLLQLVAVKALQTLSLPLSEIQSRLYGLSDAELEAVIAAIATELETQSEASEIARPVVWREIVIAPGLKLMVEDGFSAPSERETLEVRIRAALKMVDSPPRNENGGSSDDQRR